MTSPERYCASNIRQLHDLFNTLFMLTTKNHQSLHYGPFARGIIHIEKMPFAIRISILQRVVTLGTVGFNINDLHACVSFLKGADDNSTSQ